MVVDFLKRVATFAGRSLEFALTGQSDYAVITSEMAEFKMVTDIVKAKRVLAEAQATLARDFGIRLKDPVLLELYSGKDWSSASLRYVMHGAVGSYQPSPLGEKSSHVIHVLSGLPRGRFKAVVAHEMVHAYERETGILESDRGLREGFARWVEYKVLLAENEKQEAQKVLRLRRWRSGRSVHHLLDMERKGGAAAVMQYLHSVR